MNSSDGADESAVIPEIKKANSQSNNFSDQSKVLIALPLKYQQKIVEETPKASKVAVAPETASDAPNSTAYEAEDAENIKPEAIVSHNLFLGSFHL
jgi:hypothetical protein